MRKTIAVTTDIAAPSKRLRGRGQAPRSELHLLVGAGDGGLGTELSERRQPSAGFASDKPLDARAGDCVVPGLFAEDARPGSPNGSKTRQQ
jgi:hypothetical protein